jgi:hypothetical protein
MQQMETREAYEHENEALKEENRELKCKVYDLERRVENQATNIDQLQHEVNAANDARRSRTAWKCTPEHAGVMRAQGWVPEADAAKFIPTVDSAPAHVAEGLKKLGWIPNRWSSIFEGIPVADDNVTNEARDQLFSKGWTGFAVPKPNDAEKKYVEAMDELGWIPKKHSVEIPHSDSLNIPASFIETMSRKGWVQGTAGRVAEWLCSPVRTALDKAELLRCGWVPVAKGMVANDDSGAIADVMHHSSVVSEHVKNVMKNRGWVPISGRDITLESVAADLGCLTRKMDLDLKPGILQDRMRMIGWVRVKPIEIAYAVKNGFSPDQKTSLWEQLARYEVDLPAASIGPSDVFAFLDKEDAKDVWFINRMNEKGWFYGTKRLTADDVVGWFEDHPANTVPLVQAMNRLDWYTSRALASENGVSGYLRNKSRSELSAWFIDNMEKAGWVHFENLHDFILEQLPSFGPYPNEFLRRMEGRHWRWAGGTGEKMVITEKEAVTWLTNLDDGDKVSEGFYRDMMQAGWIQKTPEAIHHYIMRLMPSAALKELHRKGIGHKVHMKMVVSSVGSTVEFKAGEG